jgi:methylmalonyl-CoA mutase C-terminal domain/subunit
VSTERRLRVLIAKPGLDGHDRGAKVIAAALRDAGFEVVYTGLRASLGAVVQAAIQEDVDLIGLSMLSGAHLSVAERLRAGLAGAGAPDLPVVMGGVIPRRDHAALRALGIAEIFGQEDPLPTIVERCTALATARRAT